AVKSVFNQPSDLVSAGLGVGAAVAFGPTRRWIRPIVDRFLPARARLTLLFTDIVGSTQMIVDLGDERWRSLLDRYRAAVRQELSGAVPLDDAGRHELKGVPGEWQLFAVQGAGGA